MLRSNIKARTFLLQVRFLRYKTHIPKLKNKPSKQKNQKDELNLKQLHLMSENPADIEKQLLKLGFQETSLKQDDFDKNVIDLLAHNNPGFKNSVSNLRRLKANLSGIPSFSNERLKIIFQYLIKESQNEISRLNTMPAERLQELIRKNKYDELDIKKAQNIEDLGDLVFKRLTYGQDIDNVHPLRNTEQLLDMLMQLDSMKEQVLSIEQLVEAFELSKLISVPSYKLRGMLLSGRLLYSNGKIRMDPVNESFYIDGLVYYGYHKQALQIFESRKGKVNQKWWIEMGLMCMLQSNEMGRFDLLLKEAIDRFGGSCIRPKIFKIAIRKKLGMQDFNNANKLTDLFLDVVKVHGCEYYKNRKSNKMINFQNQQEANEFLNKQEIPKDSDFRSIIKSHLFYRNQNMAFKVFAIFIQCSNIKPEYWDAFMDMMRLPLIKDFSLIREALKPFLNSNTERELLNKLEERFNFLIESLGLTNLRKAMNSILFSDIESFVSNSALTSLLYEYMIKHRNNSTNNDSTNNDSTNLSKKFYGILKLLLDSQKENSAKKILQKLEESQGDSMYPKVNGHHYAVFIDHYRGIVFTTRSTGVIEKYTEKVNEIIKSMHNFGIEYNSEITASLISYFRVIHDFNKCFSIINQLLSYRIERQEIKNSELGMKSFYRRRMITKKLYMEIWNSYKTYNGVFYRDWSLINKTSNIVRWKSRVASAKKYTKIKPRFQMIELFNLMVNYDNLLPFPKFYSSILQAISSGQEWTTMLVVLGYMREIHGIKIQDALKNFLEVSLLRAYVKHERKILSIELTTASISSITTTAEIKVKDMIKNGMILRKYSEDPIENIMLNVTEFIKISNPQSVSEIVKLFDKFKLDTSKIKLLIAN